MDVPINAVWLLFTAAREAIHYQPTLAAWNMLIEESYQLLDTADELAQSALAALVGVELFK